MIFAISKAVEIWIVVFWVMTPCILVEACGCNSFVRNVGSHQQNYLRYEIFLSISLSDMLDFGFSLEIRDYVSQPCKTIGNIVILYKVSQSSVFSKVDGMITVINKHFP
jgi:hypothetical protein